MISIYPGNRSDARINRDFKQVLPKNLNDLASIVTKSIWSPIIWKSGIRKQDNFISSKLMVLDFDDGEMTLDQAINNTYADMKHIVGTTKSHQIAKNDKPACDRFRVILVFDREIIDLREYRYNMKLASTLWPCDPLCCDGSRLFFPCHKIVSISDGFYSDVEPVPEKFEVYDTRQITALANVGKLPGWIDYYLNKKPIPSGKRNSVIYSISANLAEYYGYQFDHIYSLVIKSPTFKQYATDSEFLRGIIPTIKSGIRKGSENG